MESGYRLKNTIKLIRSLRPYRRDMGLTILSCFFKHMSTLGASLAAARMVSLALTGELSGDSLPLLLVIAVCALIRGLSYFGEMLKGHDAAYKIQRDKRVGLYTKFDKLAPAYMSRRHSGQVAAAAMGDIEQLEWFLAHTFGSMVMAVIITILLASLLFFVHPVLAVRVLLFGLIIGLAPQIFYKQSDTQGTKVRYLNSISNSVIMEGIQGMRDIMALDALDGFRRKNRKCMDEQYQAHIEYARINGLEHGIMAFFSGGFIVLIMMLTASLIRAGRMDRGMYPVALVLAALIFNPIIELTNYARNLGITFAAASRIQEIFDTEPEVRDEGTLPDIGDVRHTIEFCHVTFGYEKEKPPVLKDVSFTIPQGSTVALVGPSGTGKTTCVNLLLRYWDPDEGCIRIGGKDIRSITLDGLHEMVSAVMQDVFLFHSSIRDNIRIGKKDASEGEIIEAARKAGAHEFIMGLPDGYDTVTGERGFRLSGGQRQRISIARALLRNAPILVLDEAVSSLDAENEQLIQKVLDETASERTTLVIAHRLSTIMSADVLIVIRDGRVVQTGSHEELYGTPGFYREMMENQVDIHA